MRKKHVLISLLILFAIAVLIQYPNKNQIKETIYLPENTTASNDCGIFGCIDDYLDFEDFDNEKGSLKPIVPDIVHLLYLETTVLKFYHVIGIFSIYFNHKPSLIYIHCDNCSFHGKYWEWIKDEPNLWNIIKVHKIPFRNKIFNRTYGWINHHRSDIWRLQILMNYGGIYLDNDMYVVNSLHKYRHYEMTVSWRKPEEGVGVQVMIAHKNARLLKAHFDAYRYKYDPSSWYYNAGYVPAEFLRNNSYLAHIVKEKLGTHELVGNLYKSYWPDWKSLDCIHLLINHRPYLDKESPIKEFDELNILKYKYTYGYMVRDILQKMNKI